MSGIHSMTGYASLALAEGAAVLHVRTVNHKALDVRIRGIQNPGLLHSFERIVRQSLGRGSVEVSVERAEKQTRGLPTAQGLATAVAQVQALVAPLSYSETDRWTLGQAWNLALQAQQDIAPSPADLEAVLELVQEDRAREGAILLSELRRILQEMRSGVDAVATRVSGDTEALVARLQTRTGQAEQSLEVPLDPAARAEVVGWIVKGDVQEEIVRLQAHFDKAESLLLAGGAIGREMGILAQEIQRESNTLMSKVQALETKQIAMNIKMLVEQLREQVANVE